MPDPLPSSADVGAEMLPEKQRSLDAAPRDDVPQPVLPPPGDDEQRIAEPDGIEPVGEEAAPALEAGGWEYAPAAEGNAQFESFVAALEAVDALKATEARQGQDAFAASDEIVLGEVDAQLENRGRDDDDVTSNASSDAPNMEDVDEPKRSAAQPRTSRLSKALPILRNKTTSGESEADGWLTKLLVGAVWLVRKGAVTLWRETSLLLLLVPYAIGFLSREDEELRLRGDLWLLRPLYALVLARLAVFVLFAIKGAAVALELMPAAIIHFFEAFRGWPATCLAFLGLHAVFYTVPHQDRNAWQLLRGEQWLIAVQWWLGALGLTRGLLEASSQQLFRGLKDGHFEQRVADAVMSMRVLRLVFATSRAARNRAAQRERELEDAETHAAPEPPAVSLLDEVPPAELTGELPPARVADGAGLSSAALVRATSGRAESELMVRDDGLLKGWLLGSITEQLAALQEAVAAGSGFVTSSHDARRRARHAFKALHAEFRHEVVHGRSMGSDPLLDAEDVPEDCLPRERVVRWCVKATRRKRPAFRKKIAERVEALFPTAQLDQDAFVAAVEAAYREQRFLSASVQSFDHLNSHLHSFFLVVWGIVMFIAGIFLVDWGVDFDAWIVPFSSSSLSLAFLLGRLPYETAAGIIYVLITRPYDIGDRILITNPGVAGDNYEGHTVAQVGLLSTRLVSWQGEQHMIQNFTARNLNIINLHRSNNPTLVMLIQVPAGTPGAKISEMLDALRLFVQHAPDDWISISSCPIKRADYKEGVLDVKIGLKSAKRRIEDGLIEQAKNRLLIFLHAYMQSAGIEFQKVPGRVVLTLSEEGLGGSGAEIAPSRRESMRSQMGAESVKSPGTPRLSLARPVPS